MMKFDLKSWEGSAKLAWSGVGWGVYVCLF